MLASAVYILYSFKEYAVFFVTPKDMAHLSKEKKRGSLRLGGLVAEDSVSQGADGTLKFRVTDLTASITVQYKGIIPSLFREGQGVVVEGNMNSGGTFIARNLLAKHDENYMPAEVVEALKTSGQWKHQEATAP